MAAKNSSVSIINELLPLAKSICVCLPSSYGVYHTDNKIIIDEDESDCRFLAVSVHTATSSTRITLILNDEKILSFEVHTQYEKYVIQVLNMYLNDIFENMIGGANGHHKNKHILTSTCVPKSTYTRDKIRRLVLDVYDLFECGDATLTMEYGDCITVQSKQHVLKTMYVEDLVCGELAEFRVEYTLFGAALIQKVLEVEFDCDYKTQSDFVVKIVSKILKEIKKMK